MRIPVVTVASLVLGALAGCGGDGDGDDEGSNGGADVDTLAARKASLSKKTCAKAVECGDGQSSHIAECEDYYSDYFDKFEERLTGQCFDLMLDYFECLTEASCVERAGNVGDEPCPDEWLALEASCEAFKPDDYEAGLSMPKRLAR